MKLKGAEKVKLEKSIIHNFPDHLCNSDAPQGNNSFSVNYLLSDSSDSKYLLKVLLKKKIKSNINKEQAVSEVLISQSINSPYLISLLETKSDADYIFLKFPFLSGSDIRNYKKNKLLTSDEITNIGINILRGIADLWRKKIVHQDIKPENIFVLNDGSIKILDFGSARFRMSPFKGTARVNFAYSSPEQILASRPGNIQTNRITIDDRADVYAVGLIMYYLIEGRHPFEDDDFPAEAIFSGKIIPPFSREDVSDGLKRIVGQMLDINQVNRPHARDVISFLESGDIVINRLQNGGFYYCVINGVNRFLTIKNKLPDLFDGVVIDASQVPSNAEDKIKIRNNVKTVLVDPQTYLFQKPKHQSKKFKKLPYFKHESLFFDMAKFLSDVTSNNQNVKNFISDVINYQLEAGATAVIPPFLYVKEFNDESWEIDQELTNLVVDNIINGSFIKPVVKGIAISKEILTSHQSRMRLLEYLTSFSDKFEGYLILLDSAHNEVISDEPWLKGARDLFIKLLSTGKYVIWSKSDFVGLVLASTGVSIAMGEMLKQRKFDIVADKSPGGKRVPYYYIPELFAKSTWPDSLEGFASYSNVGDFTCNNKCCESVDFSNPIKRSECDLAIHMMVNVLFQFQKYKKGEGGQVLKVDIENAKRYYGELKNHSDLIVREALKKTIKPSTSSFLDNWLNTLNG